MYSNIAGASMGTSLKRPQVFYLLMVGRSWGGVGLGVCGVLEEQEALAMCPPESNDLLNISKTISLRVFLTRLHVTSC